MRVVLQRVLRASVTIEGESPAPSSGVLPARRLHPRRHRGHGTLDGGEGRRTASLLRLRRQDEPRARGGGRPVLVISQFTLYGGHGQGAQALVHRRGAARASRSRCTNASSPRCAAAGFEVATGEFGADMLVEIHNDGPVTLDPGADRMTRAPHARLGLPAPPPAAGDAGHPRSSWSVRRSRGAPAGGDPARLRGAARAGESAERHGPLLSWARTPR